MTNGIEGTARLRKAAVGAPRKSAARAALFLGIAVLIAVATAVMLSRYMEHRLEGARVETVKVVVAAVDLPIATTVQAEALAVVDWPKEALPRGAFSEPSKLIGRVITAKIFRDEPLLESKLASKEAGSGLAAVLPPEMRAVAVHVDDVVGVAGFIHPGDSVDVIVTMKPSERSDAQPTSKTILQNVRVLAVGKQIERDEKAARKPIEATVATLMVNSDEAERLALAAAKGKLLLALRSSLDATVVETEGVIPPELLGTEETPPARASPPPSTARRPSTRARTAPAPAPAAASAAESDTVEILRGDRFEQRTFTEKGKDK